MKLNALVSVVLQSEFNLRTQRYPISGTGEPLFRSNDMRNILLTGFCKKYGAGYLRSMLARLLKFMADHPDQSYGIDSKLLPGSNTFENIEVVKKITRAFLDVILDSVDNMPP